jgi:alkylation response protein AidB-like acyl-CoA dehydrogenase
MSEYKAPIKDIQFLLKNVTSKGNNPSEYSDPELTNQIFQEAGKLASNVLAPLNKIGDQKGAILENGIVRMPSGFKNAYKQYIDAGWGSVAAKRTYGGQEMPWTIVASLNEIWQSANMSFADNLMLTQGAIELLEEHATEEQKKKYLPKMISGEWSGTMNLTEPQAGSDLSLLKCKAIPNNGRYNIHGNKIYITHGDQDMSENIIHLVLARLPDAPPGNKGISLFIVPKELISNEGSQELNDIRVVSLEHKLGHLASPTCVLAYGDNTGATGELIGEKNGGLKTMFTMMNNARLNVGIQGVAIAERAFQQAHQFAFTRLQGKSIDSLNHNETVAIIDHPDVKRMLLDMKARIEAMRALAIETANYLDYSKDFDKVSLQNKKYLDFLTPIIKAWCTDQGVLIASSGIQVHGGMGFIEETGAAQHYRDARILPIYEGTNGIQALDLLRRKLTLDDGLVLDSIIKEINVMAEKCLNVQGKDIPQMAKSVNEATKILKETADWLLVAWKKDKRIAAAGATPFLEMCGNIFGGWMMMKSALKASEYIKKGDESIFYSDKIATASFYIDNIMIPSLGLKNTVRNAHKNLDIIRNIQ